MVPTAQRLQLLAGEVELEFVLQAISHTLVPEKGQVLCGAQRNLAGRYERGVPWGEWTHLTPSPSFLSPS